jgi:GT2 family glycosyltransferase
MSSELIKPKPLVSIVILNWNGEAVLPRCLQAVKNQTFEDYEIIVIDNASEDNAMDGIEAHWPGIKTIQLKSNLGFAAANNLAAEQARGLWLAFLNNDAFPHPEWLEHLVQAAEKNRGFLFFSSMLIQANNPNLVESAGDILHTSASAWHRDNNNKIEHMPATADQVFSPCAAAGFYDRESFLAAGGFDPDYFSHHEDVDLGFRLRLAGLRCLHVPNAQAAHIGSASFGGEGYTTVYQTQRNMVWTYFKNMPGGYFWRYLPAHILANCFFLLHYTLNGHAKAVWKAKFDALRGLPKMLKKRKSIQSRRQINADELIKALDHSLSGPYLLGSSGKKIKQFGKNFGLNHSN